MTTQTHNNSQDMIKETPQAWAQFVYTIVKNNATTVKRSKFKAHHKPHENKIFPKYLKAVKKMGQAVKEVVLSLKLIACKSDKITLLKR